MLHVAYSDRSGKSECHGLVFAIGCRTDRPAAFVHIRTIPILEPSARRPSTCRLYSAKAQRQKNHMTCAVLARKRIQTNGTFLHSV